MDETVQLPISHQPEQLTARPSQPPRQHEVVVAPAPRAQPGVRLDQHPRVLARLQLTHEEKVLSVETEPADNFPGSVAQRAKHIAIHGVRRHRDPAGVHAVAVNDIRHGELGDGEDVVRPLRGEPGQEE